MMNTKKKADEKKKIENNKIGKRRG